jgi:UbiD family decarboxylase
MTYSNFREFLNAAERSGLLRRVAKSVDSSWEPASIAKWMFHALPIKERFGLMFDDVEGARFPLVIGALGASVDTYALALQTEPDGLNDRWLRALSNPIEPMRVDTAPCQENVQLGDDAVLADLPIPVWTPGKDPGPYITTITVTQHATSGAQNMGVYRTQVRDDRSVIANLNPGRQGHTYAATWLERGQPAPIAWVVGAEPAVHLATVANLPLGVDEITIAGGLKGAPIEMVRAKTSDLLVPAHAEIIIEGEVVPGAMEIEGPFGECAGYMSSAAPKPIVRITAITHRNDAIYYGLSSQMPPSESTVLQSLSNAPLVLHMLHKDFGEKTVCDAYIDLMFGGGAAHIVVAMKTLEPGHAMKVGRLIAENTLLKRITIVDDDIDPCDPIDLDWVMSSHYDPQRDTEIIGGIPMPMDHAVMRDAQGRKLGSKIIVDATRSLETGATSLPDRDIMDKARASWDAAGLPRFDIPRRLKYRLDRSG